MHYIRYILQYYLLPIIKDLSSFGCKSLVRRILEDGGCCTVLKTNSTLPQLHGKDIFIGINKKRQESIATKVLKPLHIHRKDTTKQHKAQC